MKRRELNAKTPGRQGKNAKKVRTTTDCSCLCLLGSYLGALGILAFLSCFGHFSISAARPSSEKKPTTSVTVVAKIVDDCAGSNPSDFMMNGMPAPVTHASV